MRTISADLSFGPDTLKETVTVVSDCVFLYTVELVTDLRQLVVRLLFPLSEITLRILSCWGSLPPVRAPTSQWALAAH